MKRSVLVAAAALLSSMLASAETIEVSRLDATTLQVNLSGVEGARTLWLAMDSSDKGNDSSSWSHWCRVSDLPAGSTRAYAKIPKAESVRNCPFVRCFLFEKDKLPGAETLASATPANAMVDTGYTPGGKTRVVMDVQLGDKAQALFCSRGSDNFDHTYTLFHITDTQMRYDYGYDPKPSSFPYVLSIVAHTRYTFEMGPSGLSASHEGVVTSSYSNQHPSDFVSPSQMYLFAANNSGANLGAYFSGVFYSLKAWPEETDAATLALDLVPARKNGTVGVFDRAGGGFIAPTSGSMTAGAVVASAGTACAVSSAVNVANYVGIESVDASSRTLTVKTAGVSSAGTLWVAYGTSDAGDDIVSWPHCAPVGEVSSGDSCKTFRLPYGWNKSFTHIRCFVLTSGALPGATTLESVTPSGALVNTGFRPTGRSRVEIDCQLASTGQGVFCARNSNNVDSYSLMHMHTTYCRFDYGSAQMNVYWDQGMRQTIVTAPWGLAIVTNGIQSVRWTNASPNQFEAGSDLYLFAAHNGGGNPGSYFTGTFYGMKALAEDLDGESLALDLVPAKRGGNVGLFNRATGEFLQPSNDGTLSEGSEVKASADVLAASRTHVCEACTVTVVSQNDRAGRLTLAFTGVETDAELWIGMGTRDSMDDALGWSEYVKIADVPQGARTAEVELPAGWGESYRRLRCLLYSKGSVPGGERLAWLTTSGAYVPVGYTPTGKTAVEIKARYEDIAGSMYAMFCARGSSGGSPYALLADGMGNLLRYDYYVNYASNISPVPPGRNNYSFLVDARGVYANGVLLKGTVDGEKSFTAGGELYLFAYHNAGTSFSGMANCTFSGARIWSDYEDPDSLLMDIVPYRKGDVVGLYDVKRRVALPAYVGGTMTAGASRGDGVLAQSATVKCQRGFVIVFGGASASRRTKLFMAGDSTLDEHRGENNPNGYVSWGSSLRPYLNDNVDIVNYARAGFSTADFMGPDSVYGNVVRWDRIKNEASAGDWVLIQFGHNDEKTLAIDEYKANLRTMVSDVKAKGATPVLATPIVRLTFENGALVDNSFTPPLDAYADAMRAVAAETSTQLAEVRELSRAAALKTGEAEALTWNVANDKTHLAQKGAELYASLFYDYIKGSGLGFAVLFR